MFIYRFSGEISQMLWSFLRHSSDNQKKRLSDAFAKHIKDQILWAERRLTFEYRLYFMNAY